MLLVPAPTEKANAVSGAIRVICFGRLSMTRAATVHHPVDAAGRLHHRGRGDHGEDDRQRRRGRLTGASRKMKTRTNDAEAAPEADPDAAGPGAHEDAPRGRRAPRAR